MISSCSSDDNNESNSSTFEGNWSGQYSGDDNGTWTVNINSNGIVSGTANSSVFMESYEINGNVTENGTLTATLGTTSFGGEFIGEINGNNANGTWTNNSLGYSGTWNGSRE